MPAAVSAVLDGDVAVRMTDALADVYAEAFATPPHHEPPGAADRFRDSLARHARLPGFRAAVAWARGADLVGFGYGHTSLPGQWWHDRAAAALPPEARTWLDEPFVIVVLAVRPRMRRQGIGGLHGIQSTVVAHELVTVKRAYMESSPSFWGEVAPVEQDQGEESW